jgi:putative spermidine/putrescine transport system permease protein
LIIEGHHIVLREHRSAVLVLPAIALLTALFVFPLIDVFKLSLFSPELSLKNFEQFFGTSVYLRVFFNTMQLSVVVTALSVVVGYPAAYILAKTDPGFRPYLIFLILIPFWSSILVRSYTWIVLLGREGVVNSLLQALSITNEPIKMLYTSGAVYVAMVQILLPIMILTCYSVMVEIDDGLVRAARVLGAGAGRAFLHVFLPLSLSGVSTGAIIIFILSTGFFITPALVGGPKDIMIANLIDFQLNQTVNWGLASAMAVVLLVSTMTVVLLFRLATRSDYLAR